MVSTSVSAQFEDCPKSTTAPKVEMTGRNIGDLLNGQSISWGYFSGGFKPTSRNTDGTAVCGSRHVNIGGESVEDYHDTLEPFQYYKSTSNPHHLPPASVAEIGHNGQANHQYDLTDFWSAVDAGQMPAVSYLKPAVFQDAHPAQPDPLDEQHFIVDALNRLQKSKDWKDTAVVLADDDSDGWYDHQMSPIVNTSQSSQDALTGDGVCGARSPLAGYQNRCGYGPRQPLMVFSPYSKGQCDGPHDHRSDVARGAWRTTGCRAGASATIVRRAVRKSCRTVRLQPSEPQALPRPQHRPTHRTEVIQ